jgi:hypothetical protein
VSEGGGGTLGLERLFTDWREEDGVKAERSLSGTSNLEMAKMGRIKTASKESPPAMGLAAFGVGWGTHEFMVTCVRGQGGHSSRRGRHTDKIEGTNV